MRPTHIANILLSVTAGSALVVVACSDPESPVPPRGPSNDLNQSSVGGSAGTAAGGGGAGTGGASSGAAGAAWGDAGAAATAGAGGDPGPSGGSGGGETAGVGGAAGGGGSCAAAGTGGASAAGEGGGSAAGAGGASGEGGVAGTGGGGSGGAGGSSGTGATSGGAAGSGGAALCNLGGACVGTLDDLDGAYFSLQGMNNIARVKRHTYGACNPLEVTPHLVGNTALVHFQRVGETWKFLTESSEGWSGIPSGPAVTWLTTTGSKLTFTLNASTFGSFLDLEGLYLIHGTIDMLHGTLSLTQPGAYLSGMSCSGIGYSFIHDQGHLVGRSLCGSSEPPRPCAPAGEPTAMCDGTNAGSPPMDEDFRGRCGMKDVVLGGFSSVMTASPTGLKLTAATAAVPGVPAAEWPEGAWDNQRRSALFAAEVSGGNFVAELDAPDLMVRAADVSGPTDERWLTALGKTTTAGVTTAAPVASFPNGRYDTNRWRVCRIGATYHLYSLAISPVVFPWPYGAPQLGWTELYTIDRQDLAGAVDVGVPVDRGSGHGITLITGLRFGHVASEEDCTAPLY